MGSPSYRNMTPETFSSKKRVKCTQVIPKDRVPITASLPVLNHRGLGSRKSKQTAIPAENETVLKG